MTVAVLWSKLSMPSSLLYWRGRYGPRLLQVWDILPGHEQAD